jgi:hypothetical protein
MQHGKIGLVAVEQIGAGLKFNAVGLFEFREVFIRIFWGMRYDKLHVLKPQRISAVFFLQFFRQFRGCV